MKFCEALGVKDVSKHITQEDMKVKVEEYFQDNPDTSVLFVFEDIEYYVETTR